jgi:hypothetical protein
MKKTTVHILTLGIVMGILFLLAAVLFPTKARKLNHMWQATLTSKQGSITHESKQQEGDNVSECVNEYEYEDRSDGFYYKRTTYNFEDDGTRKVVEMFESFENGRKLAFDGGTPQEVPADVSIISANNLKDVIGGIWEELNRANVKNIEEEKNGEETIYHVEFAVKNKESEAGTLNPNVLSIYTKRTMTVTYNEQEKRIKRIDIMRTGVKNSAEYVPVSDQDILTFK